MGLAVDLTRPTEFDILRDERAMERCELAEDLLSVDAASCHGPADLNMIIPPGGSGHPAMNVLVAAAHGCSRPSPNPRCRDAKSPLGCSRFRSRSVAIFLPFLFFDFLWLRQHRHPSSVDHRPLSEDIATLTSFLCRLAPHGRTRIVHRRARALLPRSLYPALSDRQRTHLPSDQPWRSLPEYPPPSATRGCILATFLEMVSNGLPCELPDWDAWNWGGRSARLTFW